ncbi:MAG: hypothetical protein RMJ00_00245 [Nitrososphaerota archaeon]|nr:hypothetical protein [Nitrososphaerota archaeon]
MTVGSMRFEGVRVDRYARIWIGRSRMSEAGLRKGLKVRFEWISPSALKITPLDIPVTPDHDSVRDMLYEIGLLKGRIALREYPIEGMRVDVVWKRIEKGNPYIAFEVQIAGNFFEALTKLKHAWDLWNSIPFLVTTEEYIDKALKLVEGSFHEIKHVIRVVGWRSVEELYNLLKKVRELEAEMKLS